MPCFYCRRPFPCEPEMWAEGVCEECNTKHSEFHEGIIIKGENPFTERFDMVKIRMNDQRSVTDQLHSLINLADAHGLYDAAGWVKDQMKAAQERISTTKIPIPSWTYQCNECGDIASDEDNEMCYACGSTDIVKNYACGSTDIRINLKSTAREIASMLVHNVCTDPPWIASAKIKVFNLALRYARFSARIKDFNWDTKGNAQALGIRDVSFRDDSKVEPDAVEFLNRILKIGITTIAYYSAVNEIVVILERTRSAAQWVRDLRDPVNEYQVVRIIRRYLLNKYQSSFLQGYDFSIEDVLNGRFQMHMTQFIVCVLFKPWNEYIGEEIFRV